MKLPRWLQDELAQIGRKVLSGETARNDAAGILADQITENDTLARAVAADFARKQLRGWIRSHGHSIYLTTSEDDTQLELFTYLPPFLETSPGRFARVDTMTAADWDAAVKQSEVKADNAANYAKAIRRAYDQVRPLLIDEAMTTADVAAQLGS